MNPGRDAHRKMVNDDYAAKLHKSMSPKLENESLFLEQRRHRSSPSCSEVLGTFRRKLSCRRRRHFSGVRPPCSVLKGRSNCIKWIKAGPLRFCVAVGSDCNQRNIGHHSLEGRHQTKALFKDVFMLIHAGRLPLPFLLGCDEDECSELLRNQNRIVLFH